MRDKYHDLLLEESSRQVDESFQNDKLEQLVMRKEYEYSAKVLHFQIQVLMAHRAVNDTVVYCRIIHIGVNGKLVQLVMRKE